MNRDIKNLRRLSGAACRKLESILRIGARVLRDQILDEKLNRHAERYDVNEEHDACAFEAGGALGSARDIAVALGKAYRDAYLTGFALHDWYQACGLDPNGELYDFDFSEGS